MERTLVLIKPEGVKRGISGAILKKFEQAGLKIVAIKMLTTTKEQLERHYTDDPAWLEEVGNKSIKSYEERGVKLKETAPEIGKRVRKGLMDALASGPVIAFVLEGNEAVAATRKLVGATSPAKADPSSIRGKYSTDSYALADQKGRPVRTIVHASDSPETASKEIAIWFKKSEIFEYKRADEDFVY